MSDVARRRLAALLLAAGIAVAALAIADVGPFEDPPTEEEKVTTAVERFFGAAADGDASTFCSLLTGEARQTLRVNTAQRLQINDLPKCEQILEALAEAFAGSEFVVRQVSVSGNRARVEARYKLADAGAEPRTVLMLMEEGEWKVSDPG
jgi:hypothetical protein